MLAAAQDYMTNNARALPKSAMSITFLKNCWTITER